MSAHPFDSRSIGERVMIAIAFLIAYFSEATSQTIVDSSRIGTIYQHKFIELLGKSFDNPRTLELKMNENGSQSGIICGQLRDPSSSGVLNKWHFYAADTYYQKLTILLIKDGEYADEDMPTAKKLISLCGGG